MIKLIVGNKGSGKTKALIQLVNSALSDTKGNVVVIEKGSTLVFNIKHTARLIDAEDYIIKSFDTFYGFIAGLFAGNYDITEMFVDATLKIGGGSVSEFGEMVLKLDKLIEKNNANLIFTVSCAKEELPVEVQGYVAAF